MKMGLYKSTMTICVLLLALMTSPTSTQAKSWFEFDDTGKRLTIIYDSTGSKKRTYKIKGTAYNPKITSKGTLLFGTGAGYIYEYDKNGLRHVHEENGIFYHVIYVKDKIVALSGTPLNSGGTANIIIFSNNYENRSVLFTRETGGITFVSYLKNNDEKHILVNLGGYYYGNNYYIIDIDREEIVWSKVDTCSLMVPYRSIPSGFEFISAETDVINVTEDKNGEVNLITRYQQITEINILSVEVKNDGNIKMSKRGTNLTDFIDITKKYSCVAAWCEEKIFEDLDGSSFGYEKYQRILQLKNELHLQRFPRLKETMREDGEKVIFQEVFSKDSKNRT